MAEGEPAGAGEARVSVEPRPGGGVRIDDRIDRPTFTVRPDRRVAPERLFDHRPDPHRRAASVPWDRDR
jgi:hypothetical protein